MAKKRKPSKQPSEKQLIQNCYIEYLDTAEKANGALAAANIFIDTYPQLTWGVVVDAEVVEQTDKRFEENVAVFKSAESRIQQNQVDTKNIMEKYQAKKYKADDAHFHLLTAHQDIILETLNLPIGELENVTRIKTEYASDNSNVDMETLSKQVDEALSKLGE